MSETRHRWDDFNLSMTRGDELKLSLAVTRTQAGVTSPQDVTGGTVRLIGKRSLSDDQAVFDLHSGEGGGIEIESPTGGTALATIAPEQTAVLPADQLTTLYVRGVWVDDSGRPHTWRTGKLVVHPG